MSYITVEQCVHQVVNAYSLLPRCPSCHIRLVPQAHEVGCRLCGFTRRMTSAEAQKWNHSSGFFSSSDGVNQRARAQLHAALQEQHLLFDDESLVYELDQAHNDGQVIEKISGDPYVCHLAPPGRSVFWPQGVTLCWTCSITMRWQGWRVRYSSRLHSWDAYRQCLRCHPQQVEEQNLHMVTVAAVRDHDEEWWRLVIGQVAGEGDS